MISEAVLMFEQFKALLVDELQVEEDKITPDAELSNDLGINSIELAELVMRCEETFGVDIQDDDIHNFVTVGDVVKYLESLQSKNCTVTVNRVLKNADRVFYPPMFDSS